MSKRPKKPKKAQVPVALAELQERLREQIDYLQSSARDFDAGKVAEAKRLAVSIRVLVHDTERSRSLLKQLGLKDKLQFHDIVLPDSPNNVAPHHGLVGLQYDGKGNASYYAHLDSAPPHGHQRKPFTHWWKGYVIRIGRTPLVQEEHRFTREDLVLAFANREGGAHVDGELDEDYALLSRFNSLGWRLNVSGQEREWSNNPVPHCVRQIAHELLKTLGSTA
jgi:hypothetical protein